MARTLLQGMVEGKAFESLPANIGRRILQVQHRAGWGARVVDRLSEDLRRAFPDTRGFSTRNRKYMRAFDAWPDEPIVQEALAQNHLESQHRIARQAGTGPTIIRGSFLLPASTVTHYSSLITSDGRKVMELRPGENDVRHLAPGVYFVRPASGAAHGAASITRVVVVR